MNARFDLMHPKAHKTPIDTRIAAFVLGMNETGLTAVRCLGREGIAVRGFDIAANRAGFRSRYCLGGVCPDPLHQQARPRAHGRPQQYRDGGGEGRAIASNA